MNKPTAILLISCPDRTGLIAAVTAFLHANNGNVVDLEQHVDDGNGVFFMRVEWELDGFGMTREDIAPAFERALAGTLQMSWQLHFSDHVPRMAVLVSKLPHCLNDILARVQGGEWQVSLPLIVSNHDRLAGIARIHDIDFEVLPITPDTRVTQERALLEVLRRHRVDFVVLARYMQILSPDFLAHYPHRIINIHHSFLPAFPGARPYHSAHERGVKIIGATSHYVTEDLDAGPIIEQDVVRVRHTDSVTEMVRKGRDVEKLVLSRAIWRHLRHQVLVHRNRTVVFG